MKKIAPLTLLFLASSIQAAITTEWSLDPGGAAIATDTNNHVYTVHSDANPGSEIKLTRRDPAGNNVWLASAPNITTGYEMANWVSVDNQGNIIVTGTLQGGSFANRTNRAGLVMKFDAAGKLLWLKRFDGLDNGSYTRKHGLDAENNIYVIGVGKAGIAKVKKYAPDGTLQWSYGKPGTLATPYGLSITPDNHVLAMTSAANINGNIIYAKLDKDGHQQWRKRITSRSHGYAAGDAFGNTYLAHMEYSVTDEGVLLKKLSPTGAVEWKIRHTALLTPFVTVGNDNAPILSGYKIGTGMALLKYDGNRNLLWQNLDADGATVSLQQWSPSQTDDLNNVYLQGFGALCKVNNNGTSAWATGSNGNDAGFAVGSAETIYTVGATTAKLIAAEDSTPTANLNLSSRLNHFRENVQLNGASR